MGEAKKKVDSISDREGVVRLTPDSDSSRQDILKNI